MKYISIRTVLLSVMAMFSYAAHAEDNVPDLRGPYLGQTPPGTTPVPFAPGIITTDDWEYGVTFAPGMKELYWIRMVDTDTEQPKQEVVIYEQKGETWHQRIFGPRRGTPTLSTDGNIMFFGRSYKERVDGGWSEPKRLGPDFEDIRIMRVTSSSEGTYVFDEAKPDSVLRYSRLIDGVREAPKPLPEEINTGTWNAHPFIAHDESYIIWDGQRGGDVRNSDLFISFKQRDGSWGEALKFGDAINTPSSEFAATVTPDGKYLFFNRNMGPNNSHENVDTFWVSAQVIEELRPQN